jgi:hypothetical protein
MIISHGRQYIFVHIPKTGGTAMALALEARAMADDLMLGDTPKASKRRRKLQYVQTAGRLWKHSTLADIEGLVTPAQMASYFTFTLVRNPWDRMVSYYHWLRDQSFDHPAVSLAQRLDFSRFVHHPHTQTATRAMPYGGYMTGSDGVERCRAFIRLEHFGDDAAPLAQHLGFELVLAPANTSARVPDYRGYYSASDVDLVADLCAPDIARFGYSFE